MARGLKLLEELDDIEVTIADAVYPASGGPVTRETVVEEGGEVAVRRRVVQIRQAELATRPADGTLVTIGGESWRVTGASADQRALAWKITLEGTTSR